MPRRHPAAWFAASEPRCLQRFASNFGHRHENKSILLALGPVFRKSPPFADLAQQEKAAALGKRLVLTLE
jgi:hypothetical protein